jgi:ABC-type transporter Mla MlaB component
MRDLTSASEFPTITIRVSGSLSQAHLAYLEQLVTSAMECALWPMLDLANLEQIDDVALAFLMGGEQRHFGLIACPTFIREWMQYEKDRAAA